MSGMESVPFVEQVSERLQAVSPAVVFTILALLLGGLVLASRFIVFGSTGSRRDTFLIVGASPLSTVAAAPGKTTLYHMLRTGHAPQFGTVPSQVTNSARFAPAKVQGKDTEVGSATSESTTDVQLMESTWVDFPGHMRLRPQLGGHVERARAVICVVDGTLSGFSRTARDTAELLYEVLTNAVATKHGTPVAVFCNKRDLGGGCISEKDVRTRLEAELERTRKARAAGLSSAANATVGSRDAVASDEDALLGYENEAFRFDHVPNQVHICGGSAKTGDVAELVTFLAANA